MSYAGAPVTTLSGLPLDHSRCDLVIVSGDGPNVCGHMLLMIYGTQGQAASYFHIGAVRDYPYYMPQARFTDYLRENGKRELGRRFTSLPRPRDAALYLQQAIAQKWTWGVLPNNCVAFCEEYINAGGADYSMWTNCPAVYDQQNPAEWVESTLRQMYNTADQGIRRIYGLPPWMM
jgi:hypothetical protein